MKYNPNLITWIRITPHPTQKGMTDIIHPNNAPPTFEECAELIKAGFCWTSQFLIPNKFCFRGKIENIPDSYY